MARSFLTFPIATFPIAGKFAGLDVTSASVSLHETWSWSCTAKPVNAYWTKPANANTVWTTQPGLMSTSVQGTATVAKGYSTGCAAGRVSVPLTAGTGLGGRREHLRRRGAAGR